MAHTVAPPVYIHKQWVLWVAHFLCVVVREVKVDCSCSTDNGYETHL